MLYLLPGRQIRHQQELCAESSKRCLISQTLAPARAQGRASAAGAEAARGAAASPGLAGSLALGGSLA